MLCQKQRGPRYALGHRLETGSLILHLFCTEETPHSQEISGLTCVRCKGSSQSLLIHRVFPGRPALHLRSSRLRWTLVFNTRSACLFAVGTMLRLAEWKDAQTTDDADKRDEVRSTSQLASTPPQPSSQVAGVPTPASLRWLSQQRLQQDLTELGLTAPELELQFPDLSDISRFIVTLSPAEGWYKGLCFRFAFTVLETYPFEPPLVRCLDAVWHPNLDEHGAVCLSILREDWRPVYTLVSLVQGLLHLLLEPNPNDALNAAAAEMLVQDPAAFQARVHQQVRERQYHFENAAPP